MTIELTNQEAALVKSLMELYDAAWSNPHNRVCECELCEATTRAGSHESATFDSLGDKLREVVG